MSGNKPTLFVRVGTMFSRNAALVDVPAKPVMTVLAGLLSLSTSVKVAVRVPAATGAKLIEIEHACPDASEKFGSVHEAGCSTNSVGLAPVSDSAVTFSVAPPVFVTAKDEFVGVPTTVGSMNGPVNTAYGPVETLPTSESVFGVLGAFVATETVAVR